LSGSETHHLSPKRYYRREDAEAGRVLLVEARIAISAIAAESLAPEGLAVFPMSVAT
jgi:hypothetical protein